MSNVLDLFDQTFFDRRAGDRRHSACCSASGCTTARSTSTVCAGSTTICSGDGYRAASNAHPCRSAAIAGSRPAVSPTSRSSRRLGRAKNSTPGSASRPTPPLDAEHGPEWHLAVLPFTDGGAGVSLVISHMPHRRRRAVRGVDGRGVRPPRSDQLARRRVTPAVASTARGRPPNRARHPRYRPRRRRRSTTRAAQPRPSAAQAALASQPPAPSAGAGRTHHAANGNDLRRRRRVGRPRASTRGDQQHAFSRAWRPGSPSEWDGSPPTVRSPWRYPSTSAPTVTPAPTRSQTSTSRSTPHPRRPTCATSGPQPSKR